VEIYEIGNESAILYFSTENPQHEYLILDLLFVRCESSTNGILGTRTKLSIIVNNN